MEFFCLYLLCWGGGARILPIGANGFYDWKVPTLHRVGDNFLYGGKEGLILFSPEGVMVKKIMTNGDTPVPLDKFIILGVRDNEILVISSDKSIVGLDHNLSFKDDKYPVFPQNLRGNVRPYGYYFQDQFILRKKPPHLFQSITLGGKGWELVASLSRQGPWEAIQIHSGHFFIYQQNIAEDEDTYSISVYDQLPVDREKTGMVQVLSSAVGDFPIFHEALKFRLGIQMIGKTTNGYLVEVFARIPGKPFDQGGVEFFWDFFSKNGAFIKRERLSRDAPTLVPVVNGSELFFIDDEEGDLVLREFSGDNGPS